MRRRYTSWDHLSEGMPALGGIQLFGTTPVWRYRPWERIEPRETTAVGGCRPRGGVLPGGAAVAFFL